MTVINQIVFSKTEPRKTNVIWARPVQGGFTFYLWDGRWNPMKIMDSSATFSPDDDTAIDVEGMDNRIDQAVAGVQYTDVYMGAGSTIEEVMIEANYYDSISKGAYYDLQASGNKVWVICPDTYVPSIMMGGVSMPVSSSYQTIEEQRWFVQCSDNTYTGELSIQLL